MMAQKPRELHRVRSVCGSWRRAAHAVAGLVAVVATVAYVPSAHAVEPVRPAQWYLDAWKIEEAWKISQGDGVTIALVDSGVNDQHPDLVGQVSDAPTGVGELGEHGTSMAASIAGTGRGVGGQGVFGVAPKAKIVSYKSGHVDGLTDVDETVPAIRAAADSPAKIINLSFSGASSGIYEEVIRYAQSRGKLVISAAGNRRDFSPSVTYPASVPGVLGVGGHDRNGTVWSNTRTGRWVSIAAPSVDIVSACLGTTGYCTFDGTSSATALTSGVAALVWAKYPHYTANQVIRVLIESANKPQGPLPNDLLGWGNVSPRQALNWTGDPGPPDVNPLIGVRGDMPSPSADSALSAPSPVPSGHSAQPPTTSPTPAPEAVGAPSDDDGGLGGNVLVIVGVTVAGAGVLATGVLLLVRARRNRSANHWS